jgi:hypothetical protein
VISLHDSRYVPAVLPAPSAAARTARDAFRREAGLPDALPPPYAWFPHAAQVFLRDAWTSDSAYLTFDAAPRRSFHWHPSRNSITLFAHGRALLVDPGYTFATDRFPCYGHRTAHHNTITINGYNQSACPAALRLDTTPGYALVEGLYGGGYWPLEAYSHGPGVFGEHHRTMLWIAGRIAVVLDHVHHTCGDGHKPDIETAWQLSEGPAACDAEARRVITGHDHGNLLLLFPLVLPRTALTLHCGERDPMRGWLPVEWGRSCVAAPLLRVVAPAYDPWHGDTATVLVPFPTATPPAVTAVASGPEPVRDSRCAGCLRIEEADTGTCDLVAWTRRMAHAIGAQHGLDTDGSLVHLHRAASGAVASGLLVDGTYCTVDGADVTPRLQRIHRVTAAVGV